MLVGKDDGFAVIVFQYVRYRWGKCEEDQD